MDDHRGKGQAMIEQSPSLLENAVEFAENPEPRCPCVLLLDTSGSMKGEPIEALNQGLQAFKEDVCKDTAAARRVEVAVVTFDSELKVVQDFVTVDDFEPPTLQAQGLTCMGGGILKALDMIRDRKVAYKANGVSYYRPWVFLITDGQPEGESEEIVNQAARRIHEDEARKRVVFFAVGVENANLPCLKQIVVREPLKLRGLAFREMFVWLSGSMTAVSHSKTDAQIALPPADDWGSVG